MASHRFQCRCGQLKGMLDHPEHSARAVCYCTDCQAYAHLLGCARQELDSLGGTDIVAVPASQVRFTAGAGKLACLSLSPRGLLRWYASCCDTPIANTLRNWKLPYVGMPHSCLSRSGEGASKLPPVQMHVNTKSAHGPVPRRATVGSIARFIALVARLGGSRLLGGYRRTPFFDAQGGPVCPVTVAAREAVEAARAQVPQKV